MQIRAFNVEGLFGQFDHAILFAEDVDTRNRASVTIIHGLNGVGKTTLLRMLNGMMHLDFDEFRRVPFARAALEFNNGEILTVSPATEGAEYLSVTFDSRTARLHPERSGPLTESLEDEVEQFRSHFRKETASIHFELIETTRLAHLHGPEDDDEWTVITKPDGRRIRRRQSSERTLAQRVYHFINEALADYRRFFSVEHPAPWQMILHKLEHEEPDETPSAEVLRERIIALAEKQAMIGRSGLADQEWGFTWMTEYLNSPAPTEDRRTPLTVLSTYLGLLETRMDQHLLLAERLLMFAELLSSFFSRKRVWVDSDKGFVIETDQGQHLTEKQLSSGEYHLLYLMVRALVARRRGTVIAIDEPELSMHISWQRKLVKALCDCAAGGEPQFLLATHSPDIARDFRDSMIRLGDAVT